MNDRKNIDRYFQERFKDFEAEPDKQVWDNIEAILKKKKQRRVIPLWFRWAGAAAILLLGLLVFDSVNEDEGIDTGIVKENTSEPLQAPANNAVANGKNDPAKISNPNAQSPIIETISASETSDPAENNIAGTTATQSGANSINNRQPSRESGILAGNQKDQQEAEITNTYDKVATNNQNEVGDKHNNESAIMNDRIENRKAAVADNAGKSNVDKASPGSTSNKIDNPSAMNNKANDDNIVGINTDTDIRKLDSTAVATVVPNALEELLANNEKEEKIVETNLNRWQITSSVAPIYFSSASNGSPIDGQFSENSKSYDKNLSIGVGVNYALNKKISVRTGVNRFTLGYNTNDVVFFAGLNSQSFDNISRSDNGANIEIVNSGDEMLGLQPFEANIRNTNDGSISQRMGYFEVPVEMSYKVIDRKFGVTLIGGVSTLFLNENTVSVVSQNMSASLGEASNLNDVHFSSNIGVGFKYSFWNSFQFNFEPMFKYQINTFSKDAGNFKPYFIGLYSGVSFSF